MRSFALWKGGAEVGALDVAHQMQLPPANGGEWIELPGLAADWMLAPDSKTATGYIIKARSLPPAVALDVARGKRWDAAKAYRATAEAAGCDTALGRVQTDLASRDAIREAAGEAIANQVKLPGWSVGWIMTDNTTKTHSAAQMIAMAAAVRARVAACRAQSQVIRKAIYSAPTPAAVAAVDITAGYPS